MLTTCPIDIELIRVVGVLNHLPDKLNFDNNFIMIIFIIII